MKTLSKILEYFEVSLGQAILLILMFIGLNFSIYYWFMLLDVKEYKTDCGLIVNKYTNNDVTQHKHRSTSSINMYFDMKYDNGRYEQVRVETDTYYKNSIGDRVCFTNVKYKEKQYFVAFIVILIGIVGLIVDLIVFVYLVGTISTLIWQSLSKS